MVLQLEDVIDCVKVLLPEALQLEDVIDCLKVLLPEIEFVFLFDHS
jgi:hypothetical protein